MSGGAEEVGAGGAQPRTEHEREALRLLDAAVQATGGQHRAGQREMVLQVARALESRRHLLVQAGTGTGKSLAYLIPAIQHAMTQEDPVVVATATLALQAQIMKRDAPRLVEALKDELPREPSSPWSRAAPTTSVATRWTAATPGMRARRPSSRSPTTAG